MEISQELIFLMRTLNQLVQTKWPEIARKTMIIIILRKQNELRFKSSTDKLDFKKLW